MKRSSLNHSYRLVWNEATNTYVAVAETTKARGKKSGAGLALTAAFGVLMAAGATAADLPTLGQIVGGTGSISQSANSLTINQTSARLATDWQSFSIAAGNSVNFVQPSASAVALNRVLGADVSVIQGALKANGQVFLVNPNGVLFTPSAQVNVGGIVASTLNISTADFMAGNYQFAGSSSNAIINQGNISADAGGSIAFIAAKITNDGSLSAPQGNVLLGAGSAVTLDLGGPVKLQVTQGALDTLIENGGAIKAAGGLVYLSAKAAGDLASSAINNGGLIEANAISASGTLVNNTGSLTASGTAGSAGSVNIEASQVLVQTGSITAPNISVSTKNLVDGGSWDASAASNNTANGGNIAIQASEVVLQTTAASMNADGAAGTGGSIRIEAGTSAWISGAASANGQRGGEIAITAPSLTLAGASLSATGTNGGGRIRVGGGWQGKDADLANADTTTLSDTQLDVSATQSGKAGTAVVWSESKTQFDGSIRAAGGVQGGDGGQVEVSSHGQLSFGGTVDTGAAKGNNGQLLLDPKDIEIVASAGSGGINVLSLLDPTPTANEQFGKTVTELKNNGVGINRILVGSANDPVGGAQAGAVYLYNSQTGALVSTLLGSRAGDNVGNSVTALSNGNYVVGSTSWHNGTLANAGAATWGNGSSGITGVVSTSNSLVGTQAGDKVGSSVTALTNGNYVVASPYWHNGATPNAGAATWGNGTSGVKGVVSSSNSLAGTHVGDTVGSIVTALSNGNYVVGSYGWNNGTIGAAGAATWGNGSIGIKGTISSSNSLVGTRTLDSVGYSVTALSNGNYVVGSKNWHNGTIAYAGAATWGNGSSGITGQVSSSNSLVGTHYGDGVGNVVTALSNAERL